MAQVIVRYIANFAGVNEPITLSIPRGSEELDIRVHREPPQVIVTVNTEFMPLVPAANYQRTFMLILDGQPNPEDFRKYIASLPFGPGLIETHLIEVAPISPAVEG